MSIRGNGGLRESVAPTRIAHRLAISREMARAAGLVESTPEELAADEQRRKEHVARQVARDQILDRARVALADLDCVGAKAVLALHSESERYDEPTCDVCVSGDCDDHDGWPCQTVEAIAKAYGIEVPE